MTDDAIHLAHAACPSIRWRNGGGIAHEIASGEGWELRSAEISRSGPFSSYAGLTRHFALVQGRVALAFAAQGGRDAARVMIGDDSAQGWVFDGGLACDCTLLEGHPAIALNLIVDASRVRARIWRAGGKAHAERRSGDGADDDAEASAGEVTSGFICVDGEYRLDVFLFGRPPDCAPTLLTTPVPMAALDAAALCFRIEQIPGSPITDARR